MNQLEKELLNKLIGNIPKDIPVSAAIVHKKTIFTSSNTQYKNQKINEHAEIKVINKMVSFLNNFNLSNCELYITMEPCMMCFGAILNSKIKNVYYYIENPKTGFLSMNPNLFLKGLKIQKIDNDFSIKIKEILKNYFQTIRK